MIAKKACLDKFFSNCRCLPGAALRPGEDLTSRNEPDKNQKEPTVITVSALFLRNIFTGFSTPMKIKPEQLERIASMLVADYRSKELIVTKADDGLIKKRIMEIIAKNFAEEEAIEEEARKMLASYAKASRDMDPYKMFLLAKQKLAAKKGFIL